MCLRATLAVWIAAVAAAAEPLRVDVEGQPLAANAVRLREALQYLGAPLPAEADAGLREAIAAEDADALQRTLDPQVLLVVRINPELRVSAERGPARARLQQGGYVPVLVKVLNDAALARRLNIGSPQAGPLYSGAAEAILARQAQTELIANPIAQGQRRFLDVELFDRAPLTNTLSGLRVEYAVALVHCHEAGQREATLTFDVGAGTQDLGFRGEVPLLFEVAPAVPVRLSIRDHDGAPTTARLEFRGADGRVYPPQAKRLAPDFFFQPQIYRADGETVLLPPGEFTLTSSRGPEYVRTERTVTVRGDTDNTCEVHLQRWIDPLAHGYWCGDHHIHGAGCSHYDNPTQGVTPRDMFAQVKGEGLNVGCVLTWGPCFEHQRTYFSPGADAISEPRTLLKYDLEISGFGSAALGHVCLLNLRDQTYPGTEGGTEGWPSWTVPVLRWAKEQGGVTGYPHSALQVDAQAAAVWTTAAADTDGDQQLRRDEAAGRLLPESFAAIDSDGDERLALDELRRSAERAAERLPHLALPAMDGGGAMEIVVSTPEGVCDFISAMDTARVAEWNTWYHLLNCGFPVKLSGETDFPCMSSRHVGQGRVYVHLGRDAKLDFAAWCRGLAEGRSYVSDGFAHAVRFTVEGAAPGGQPVALAGPRLVVVEAEVAFAAETPRAVAHGTLEPERGRRVVGDTVNLHAPRDTGYLAGGQRQVEIVAGGVAVASQSVPADGRLHKLRFEVPVAGSTWVALRQFPQLHTNPVEVIVAGKPIRASRASALWCAEAVRILWNNRRKYIAEAERGAAQAAYERALKCYLDRAREAEDEGLVVRELALP